MKRFISTTISTHPELSGTSQEVIFIESNAGECLDQQVRVDKNGVLNVLDVLCAQSEHLHMLNETVNPYSFVEKTKLVDIVWNNTTQGEFGGYGFFEIIHETTYSNKECA